MKQDDIDYLDGEFTVQEDVPTTIEELKPLLGTEDAIVDEVAANLRYRNKYPRVYKAVSARVVSDHGFPRAVKETKKNADGTVKNVLESENDHLRAFLKGRANEEGVIVDAAPEANRATLQSLFTEIATAAPLYLEGEGRRGGGGKVSAGALEMANKFFAAGTEAVERACGKIEADVPGYKIARDSDGSATPESLARGIQALQKAAEAKAKRESMAGLGV